MLMRSMQWLVQVDRQSELPSFQWDAPACRRMPMPMARRAPLFRDLSDAAHRMEDCLKQPATGKVTGKVGSSTVWGGLWDSNPRLSEPQSDALPPELKPP